MFEGDSDLTAAVRDDDLRARLESARGKPGYGTMRDIIIQQQADRDAERLMTPVERRRVQTRKELQNEKFEEEDRHHIHSVLALCGLPYREPKDGAREFVREYGRNSLAVQAGFLKNPVTGKMDPQGLPCGPKARLLLLHICTMAVRQKSPEIEIADSMSAFIRDLGFPVTGGQKGTLTQFKEQLNRLAAARMQIGVWRGERSMTINSQPIRAFDVWLPRDADQRLLWSSELRLDQEFYESLREHALPVDIRALRAFSQSAKQIDIVLWLGYRMRKVERRYVITWEVLQEQFGAGVKRDRKFREMFADDIRAVQEVFPNLPVEISENGLVLKPSDPDKLFVTARKQKFITAG